VISQLYLIRHGETAWSKSGQHTGKTDLPLLAEGEAAARQLGEKLRAFKFDHVLTSPRLRARQTCELAGLGAGAKIEPDLAEWDYGDYEGLRAAEILRLRPGWNIYRDGCPGGESPTQIAERADRLIARLRRLDGTVAVFSHGHFGRVLAVRWIELPVEAAKRFQLGTAATSVLGFERGNPADPVIASWNAGGT
jgi:broad specificity phosphatase PhoE